jgi:hypothetical protein
VSAVKPSGHTEHDIHLITPAYRVPDGEPDVILNDVIISNPHALSFEAQYSCLFASLIRNADTAKPQPIRPLVLVSSLDDPHKTFAVEWVPNAATPSVGTISLSLPSMELLERAYRAQVSGEI